MDSAASAPSETARPFAKVALPFPEPGQVSKKLQHLASLRPGYLLVGRGKEELAAYGSWLGRFQRGSASWPSETIDFAEQIVQESVEQLSRGRSLGLLDDLKKSRAGLHSLRTTLAGTPHALRVVALLDRIENFVTRFEHDFMAKMEHYVRASVEPALDGMNIRQTPIASPPTPGTSAAVSISVTAAPSAANSPPRTPPSSPRSLRPISRLDPDAPLAESRLFDSGLALVIDRIFAPRNRLQERSKKRIQMLDVD